MNIPSTPMLVSVAVTTYNQEKYIAECLDGILMQKVNFPIEIVICEDCSTDNTLAICREYAEKNSCIRLIANNPNIGYHKNFLQLLKECRGKYVALCEGDDYWIDENKLQKQVDLMERHTEYAMCVHAKKTYDESKKSMLEPSNKQFACRGGQISNRLNLLQEWVTSTCTILYRRECLNIEDIEKYKHLYDVHIYYHILKNRIGYCIPNYYASVYRLHDSYHNGRDWLHLAKVAVNNDIELFRHNREDQVVQELLDKTLKLFNDSIEYRIRTTKTINKLIWSDIKLYMKCNAEADKPIGALVTLFQWIKVLIKVNLKS